MKKLHDNLTEEEKASLLGHRQRLRNRYLSQDTNFIENNRLLELLLTFAISRKDVYLLANFLLNKFGDLAGVLDASIDDLMTVDGIGQNSAILINLISTLQRHKILCEYSRKSFDCPESIAAEICKLYYGITDERIMIVTFNSSMKMLSYDFIGEGKNGECDIDLRKTAKILLRDGVAHVAVAHNHPSGNINPSSEDLRAMGKIERLVDDMSVKLLDMFIVSGESYFKISEAAKLSNKLQDLFNDDFSYSFDNPTSDEVYELAELICKDNKRFSK